MRKILTILIVLSICFGSVFGLNFKANDDLYNKGVEFQKVYDDLKAMEDKAVSKEEKAGVYWRLSRVCVDLGDALDKKDSKGRIAIYTEGENYGKLSIDTYPTKESYQWHCSNIGRYGQTKGVLSSLAKVDPMLSDLKAIVDDLKVVDYSEAWYVIAVLFHSVPSKSNTEAISYARVSVDTIPSDKIWVGTYQELAEELYSRNWSASKRKTEIAKIESNWKKGSSSNMEKYKFYEGKVGVNATNSWLNGKKLCEVSDREEAVLLMNYAIKLYKDAKVHTPQDDRNYAEALEVIASFK